MRSSASREPRFGFCILFEVAEPLERVDVEPGAQLLDLQATDAGDESEVIVGAAAPIALDPPVAHVAVLGGLGISSGVARGERRLEPLFHEPVVGRVIGEPIAFGLKVMVRRDDVRFLRLAALQALEQARVHAELEDRARACLRRELRVRDLVRPVAEIARARDLAQEIGAAVPAVVGERRLVDDVRAGAHRGERRRYAVGVGRRADLLHDEPLRA